MLFRRRLICYALPRRPLLMPKAAEWPRLPKKHFRLKQWLVWEGDRCPVHSRRAVGEHTDGLLNQKLCDYRQQFLVE